ncbi:hypothetical protein AYL99_06357 [Fonsecaea erecta]|uniref:Myb-like domain-containing protein n=1 Tax=Fonsecaea erecta TaxID=1367422 RepID=A0A178ZGY2_9EURO|nr:hypothetical protein AYL99_06357 [Fonsecaea erecta]OAP59059.1 hypothetical protein AYL99_06357 [Fonsecaea erecta]
MNGMFEPLPGLLDDPLFQLPDLPALTDIQIAPLRNPAPSRHANVPLPLEPVADNSLGNGRTTKNTTHAVDSPERKRPPKITPNDVLLAREAKRPHLAISELLEANQGPDPAPTSLPSFISLSVVEKSPIQVPSFLEHPHSLRRLRLDGDNDHVALDWNRHLPLPAQKEDRHTRPAPLLPAMVTGLHEPPPSAALLPSIDLESIRAAVPGTHEPHSSSALLPSIDLDPTHAAITGLYNSHPAPLQPPIYSEPIHTTGTGQREPLPPLTTQLPSIDFNSLHAVVRPASTSRINVRDMLTESAQPSLESYLPESEPNQPDPEPTSLCPDSYHQESELFYPSPESYPRDAEPASLDPEDSHHQESELYQPSPEPSPRDAGPTSIGPDPSHTESEFHQPSSEPYPPGHEPDSPEPDPEPEPEHEDEAEAEAGPEPEPEPVPMPVPVPVLVPELEPERRLPIGPNPSGFIIDKRLTFTRAYLQDKAIPNEIRKTIPAIHPFYSDPSRGIYRRRTRRRWTDAETADLLAGVTKHGVGRWKQILEDPAYKFGDRNSVDLKDRYRVCISERPPPDSTTDLRADSPIDEASPSVEILGIRHCRDFADPARRGHKQRRRRRAWTDREDELLMEGVARHGFQWTAIHDDPDLNLSHRRATDLRDRIRNKFPDGYKHAESAPFRSEVRKAEREALSAEATVVPGREPNATKVTARTQDESEKATATDKSATATARTQRRRIRPTTSPTEGDRENMQEQHDTEREREGEREHQPLVTLPSFQLGFFDDMDWEDNRLPPLHEWDEDDDSE